MISGTTTGARCRTHAQGGYPAPLLSHTSDQLSSSLSSRWSTSISHTLRSWNSSIHGQYDGHFTFSRVGTCASTLWTRLAWPCEVASIGGDTVLPLEPPDPDKAIASLNTWAIASLNTWAIASLILRFCGSMLDAVNTSVMRESPYRGTQQDG
jgi:hypothetical protein